MILCPRRQASDGEGMPVFEYSPDQEKAAAGGLSCQLISQLSRHYVAQKPREVNRRDNVNRETSLDRKGVEFMKERTSYSALVILFAGVFLISTCAFLNAGSPPGDYPSKAGLESVTRGTAVKSSSESVRSGVSQETRAQKHGFEMNTNRYGEDYRDFDIPVADPQLCADACAQESECKAWTMVKPGIQGEQAKCWLKSKVPPPEKDECCISGLKRIPQAKGGQGSFEMNTNRYGEDYRDFDIPVADPQLCADACAQESECKAWTMVKPGIQGEQAKCWLKSKVPPPEKDECCISGLKRR